MGKAAYGGGIMKTIDSATGVLRQKTRNHNETAGDDEDSNDAQPMPVERLSKSPFKRIADTQDTVATAKKPRDLAGNDAESIARLQAEFLHLSLPLFFAQQDPIQALGVTSAVAGEGKTLAGLLVSHALASNSQRPVILVECDWQRPALSQRLNLAASPGLSEWLRGAADRSEVRRQVAHNLTIVPAGLGGADAMTALAEMNRRDFHERLASPNELLILDLPSVLGSYYGPLAARLADALLLVVRAGSTPSDFVTQACEALKQLRVEGIILNQVQARTPRWLRSLL
jgi:Mrp family chromosome partitioning ATPase